jgi:hypothetical protein
MVAIDTKNAVGGRNANPQATPTQPVSQPQEYQLDNSAGLGSRTSFLRLMSMNVAARIHHAVGSELSSIARLPVDALRGAAQGVRNLQYHQGPITSYFEALRGQSNSRRSTGETSSVKSANKPSASESQEAGQLIDQSQLQDTAQHSAILERKRNRGDSDNGATNEMHPAAHVKDDLELDGTPKAT